MQIFAFDLLPYAEHLDHLKEGKELPWRSIRSFLWPNGNLSIIGKSATLPLLQRISDGLSRGYLVIRGPCK